MALAITLNGQATQFEALGETAPLSDLIAALALKADRIAVELNGEIARRAIWPELLVRSGDKLEIVHFVGGGA